MIGELHAGFDCGFAAWIDHGSRSDFSSSTNLLLEKALMDLISTFNPPRFLLIAKQEFWVRGLTIGDFALVIAWLDDVLPGYHERSLPPRFLSDEAQAALDTPLGRCVLTYAGLRHSNVTWDRCQSIALESTPSEWSRLLTIFFRRRKNLKHSGDAEDLGESWWGPTVERFCSELGCQLEDFANFTLDQMDCLGRQGLEDEKPGILTLDEVQKMWEEAVEKH